MLDEVEEEEVEVEVAKQGNLYRIGSDPNSKIMRKREMCIG